MALSSVVAAVLLILLLLLCNQYPCSSASRPQPLLPAIKPQQQYGDGIAATQPVFSVPLGGPTQLPLVPTTPPYSHLPNFPSFQQPTLPQLPPPRSSADTGENPNNGGGESAPATAGGNTNNNNNDNNNDNTAGSRGRGDGFPYQSMPSYIPKFPPFPFIPTMPTMPSVPLPRLQPDSGGLSTATPSSSSSSSSSASSSSLSSSSPACNDKGQLQTGGNIGSQPGH